MRNDANEQKEKEFYEQYGRFIVTFEFTFHVVRSWIGLMLQPPNNTNWVNIDFMVTKDILLEGLTAKPLMEKLFGMTVHRYRGQAEKIKRLKKMTDLFINKVIPIRNKLSHGNSFPGAINKDSREVDYDMFTLSHGRIKKEGYDGGHIVVTLENFRALNENLKKYNDCLMILATLIRDGKGTIGDFDNLFPTLEFELKNINVE